jgi:hypothetical protein
MVNATVVIQSNTQTGVNGFGLAFLETMGEAIEADVSRFSIGLVNSGRLGNARYLYGRLTRPFELYNGDLSFLVSRLAFVVFSFHYHQSLMLGCRHATSVTELFPVALTSLTVVRTDN